MIFLLLSIVLNSFTERSSSASASVSASLAWEINDVTYVLPLPNPRILEVSLKATDFAENGQPLLPKAFLPGGENIAFGDILPRSAGFNTYDNLFAVGARIDPCFRDQYSDPCRRQIRITWQPVDLWSTYQPTTIDASLHTFYDLTDTEFLSVLSELQKIKAFYGIDTRNLPLGIHPGFSKTTASPFQSAFKKIILRYADSAHIRRVAHIDLATLSAGWDLFSDEFDAKQNHIPVPIFNNVHSAQQVSNLGGLDLNIMSPTDFSSDTLQRIRNYLSTVDIHSSEHSVCHFEGLDDKEEKSDQLFRFLSTML